MAKKPKRIVITHDQGLELAMLGETKLRDGTVLAIETIKEQREREDREDVR